MSRIIKFRAWLPKARKSVWSDYGTVEQRQPDRRKFGRMVEFDQLYFSISDDSLMHPQIFTDTPEHFYGEDIEKSQDGAVLLQYTGLKDKNGKEIFEGDICKYYDHEPIDELQPEPEFPSDFRKVELIGAIDFHDATFWVGGTRWWTEIEVIGNIYENPELLNQDQGE